MAWIRRRGRYEIEARVTFRVTRDLDWAMDPRAATLALVVLAAVAGEPAAPEDAWKARITDGTQALRKGELKQAQKAFVSALEIASAFPAGDPRTVETLEALSSTYVRQGRPSRAVRPYRDALEEDPQSIPLRLGLATTYEGIGKWDDAEALLKQVRQTLEARPEARPEERMRFLEQLGELYRVRGRPGDAIPLYEQLCAVSDPGDPVASGLREERLARLYADTDRRSEASEHYARALELLASTLPWNDPRTVRVRNAHAELLHERGRTEEAKQLLARGITTYRRSPCEDEGGATGWTRDLLQSMGLEPFGCRREAALCARFEDDFEAFKLRWGSGILGRARPVGDWSADRRRSYEVGDGSLVVSFDPDRSEAVVRPPRCPAESPDESERVRAEASPRNWVAGQDGVTLPVRENSDVPGFPTEATVPEASVVLRVLVLEDGRVGRVSVVECSAPGQGFEEAAVAAVEGWRYSPALKAGHPVRAWMLVSVPFTAP